MSAPRPDTVPFRPCGRARRLRASCCDAEWTKFRTVRGWVIATVVAALAIVLLGCSPRRAATSGRSTAGRGHGRPSRWAGRRGRDRHLLLRAPAAGRERQHHGPGDLADRAWSRRPRTGRQPAIHWPRHASRAFSPGPRPGSSSSRAPARFGVRGGDGHRRATGCGCSATTPTTSPACPGACRRGVATLAAADPRPATRSPATTRPTACTGRKVGTGAPRRAAVDGAGRAVRRLPGTGDTQGVGTADGAPTQATATFDHVSLQGGWPRPPGTATASEADPPASTPSRTRAGSTSPAALFTVTGSGDIAPAEAGGVGGTTIAETPHVGAFAGLIALIVVATLFITAEYRRGLIRVTLAASPRRGRVLAAKAIVIGSVTFRRRPGRAAVAVPFAEHLLRSNGKYLLPDESAHRLARAGRHGGAARRRRRPRPGHRRAATPQRRGGLHSHRRDRPALHPGRGRLPAGAPTWLLRVTPAAAFAVQQSLSVRAGERLLHVDERLLPAGAVGRAWRARRLRRARARPGASCAPRG